MKQIIMFVAIKSLSINIGDIMYTRMLQKSVRPTEIEMIEYTKSRKEYFNELIYIIEYLKQYDLLYEINFPYRNSYGWDFSYYQKKKMICILFPKDKHNLSLVWGFKGGGRPTSEAATHLLSHIERLKVDSLHRVVIHCHPTNIICMTHILPLESNMFTEILWKMQTESIVVFPEGVAVLPWILCGGTEIGKKTASLMREYRSVIWAQHGLFATGRNLDEVFGLIETIEKAAEIYIKICDKKIYQSITNDNLKEIAKAFHITYRKNIID